MEHSGAYYQLDDLKKPFVRYEKKAEIDPSKITATCVVDDTEHGLAIALVWAHRSSTGSQLLAGMKSWSTNKGLERLRNRLTQFDWKRLRNNSIRIEVRGVSGGLHRGLLIDESGLRIKKKVPEERLVVKNSQQQVVLSMYFVTPTGKRVGVSFFGVPSVEAGQVTEYCTIAQAALDSLDGFGPLSNELGSASIGKAPHDIQVGRTSEDREAAVRASTSASSIRSPRSIDSAGRESSVQRRSIRETVSLLRSLVTRSPWLELRYAVELVAFWTMIYWQVFSADWRLLLPVPIVLLIIAMAQSPLMRMAERRSNDPTLVRRVFLSLMAIGLIVSQALAFWSVPSSSKSAVFLWIYLAAFQIRVVTALARHQLNAMRQIVLSYLDPVHWVQSGDVGRYEQLTEPLRGEGTRFGTDGGRPIEAEGQSQISLLIRLFYGVIGAIVVVLTYFAIGMRFAVKDVDGEFIYENNEGFTAALALLIIVTSTVAVQMFADLARVIRERDENFEREISKLAIALGNVESGLSRIWGHLLEYLPDVSRTFNTNLQTLCGELSANDSAASSVLERGVISYGQYKDVDENLQRLSNSSAVAKWFGDGYFDAGPIESDVRRLLRQLASRLHDRKKDFASNLGVLASIPYDEKVFLVSLEALSISMPERVAELRNITEEMMSGVCLRTSRYLEQMNQPQAFGAVLTGCDNLDIDASYFLDDRFLFAELIGSAGLQTQGKAKSEIRGEYATRLRDAEFARVMYIAAWLSQVNSYVPTRLHTVLGVEPPIRFTNKVDYVARVLASDIPRVFASEAPLTQEQVRKLLTDDDEGGTAEASDAFSKLDAWLLRASLSMPESAIHCLVRAALARKKRMKFVQFETSADRWQPKRVMSLSIVPKYSDRVRHLRALLEIPDRPQNSVRMRSVHDELRRPANELEKKEVARLALERDWVDLDLVSAQRLALVMRRWDTFCQVFGPTKGMSKIALHRDILGYGTPRTRGSESRREPRYFQTVGNNAFDEVRQWYEDNDLRWQDIQPSVLFGERLTQLHNRFHRYHCLLRLVNGAVTVSRDEFRRRPRWYIQRVVMAIDPGLTSLIGDGEIADQDDELPKYPLQALIDKTKKFCMDKNNDDVLTSRGNGFFLDRKQLYEWRGQPLPESEGVTLVSDRVTEFDDRSDGFAVWAFGELQESDDWSEESSTHDDAEDSERNCEYEE